ncbi:MAG: general secretion pathway protein GspK [Candidatus Omnitrophica bacterium]|nr:general secretion pathway protein GspK [Candidatus Omnitrophota bacterium]MBU4590422.1 general secretion pathway protein GspK [Candidatus Omnitrophota bacterium]
MRENKGVALILVVSVLAVAGIMAVSFAFTMRLELKAATNFLEATRASYLAEAGVSYAQSVLKEDENDIDSFEDSWYTLFTGADVDNDDDGDRDSKWIYVYNELDEPVGRYAVLVRDETSFLNINIATKQNISPLKVTEGWTPYELDLQRFLSYFELDDSEKTYEELLDYRYGLDGEPGEAGLDDNGNQRILGSDGIDNNSDGIIDEAGEGIDEPMEFFPGAPYGDDRAFETPFELAKLETIKDDSFKKLYAYVTSYSVDDNLDVEGRVRENINFMDAASLAILLEDAGVTDPFQKAVNIADACDEDFSQSVISKLYNKLSAINRGPQGDWVWNGSRYETDVKDGEPVTVTWINLPEGEFYIGMFGVEDELVGDVTINGMTQHSVRHGELLRFGAIAFESRILNLSITNSEEEGEFCYFSHLELYPREGEEKFSSSEIRGVEGIRINEIMVKPVITKTVLSGQDPRGDWDLNGNYYMNNDPNGGKQGEGSWTWKDVPDGKYYVRVFAGMTGEYVGDVEISGARSSNMLDGELFGAGRVITVSGGKLTVNIQNNLSSGSTYFGSIELRQEPDAEYIELVNLTPRDVDLGGWSVEGPSKEGWPASIPLGTVIGSYEHMALCVDKNDSQDGVNGNGISFFSIWGKDKKAAELHFVRSITPDADLLSDEPEPGGNIITLKDEMGHVVDQVEYFSGNFSDNKSLERSDPSYIVDSNSNGIPDGWYTSEAEDGATPALPNDNDGMTEEIGSGEDIEIIEHDVTEVVVKNKGFTSVGEMAFVTLGSKEWESMPLEDVAKIADRLTVFGIRLEAEGHVIAGSGSGWKFVQRAAPMTDHFESGKIDSVGAWKWEEKDGLKDGYYTLRIFGGEEEEIAVSMHLADDTWTTFTPSLSPGPGCSILFGNIEVGTGSDISTPSGELELKIKNSSKTGGAHFDFIRMDPANSMEGRININTASKKVIGVMPGMSEGGADDIIAGRVYGNKNGLRLGIGDLIAGDALGSEDEDKKTRFKQISNLVTVHSDIYRIIVTAQTLDEGRVLSEKKIWAIFDR